jgi:hypothetical protein
MQKYIIEDRSGIPMNLGLGQAVLGFMYSPGFDNILLSSRGDEITACQAHVSMLDFQVASSLLALYGFTDIRRSPFCQSEMADMREAWHYQGEEPVWKSPVALQDQSTSVNQTGTTGFDRDPEISLIVECHKGRYVPFNEQAPHLYKGPYKNMRQSKRFILTRCSTRLIKYLNGILYTVNGWRGKRR